jgi:hypothetical protein
VLKEEKMKKFKTIVVLMCVMLLMFTFVGCSNGKDNNAGKDEPSNTPTQAEQNDDKTAPLSIKVNDDLTITDPEGLDFDDRTVLYANESNATLQTYVGMGVTIEEQYIVLYAKEDKVAGEYNYYVFADEASAAAFKGMLPTLEVTGLIGKNISTQDTIDSTIAQMQASGVMSGDSFNDYVGMYEKAYLYTQYTQQN